MKMSEDLGDLRATLSIPSYESSYSIGVQFLKDWFLSKFNKGFFKSFHVGGKHVLDDYRNFNINDILIKETPKAAMVVNVDYDHNRDDLDDYQFGIDHYIRRSKLNKSFFRNPKENIYLALYMEEMLMRCTYRIKVSERAQQIRIFKYMQMAFKVRSTRTNYIDVDFHIPYTLLLQLAIDAGFKVEKDDIKDKVGFLSYLNRYSQVPILMKFRNMTGRVEYFLRMRELYSHIAVPDNISPDDGDRNGQLDSSFMLEMTAELKIPVPKFYVYYSQTDHSNIDPTNSTHDDNVSLDLCTIVIPNIPEANEKGWALQIRTDCEDDDLTKPLELDLKELFKDSDIYKIIQYNNSMMISSDIFLDIRLYNNGRPVQFVMDWKNMKLTSTHKMVSYITNMFIYVNMEYLNDQIINIGKLYDNRISKK